MYKNNKVLAIVPARGGSKGIKGKNLRILNGKPLIEHTIFRAIESEYIDTIVLSSDDEEILSLGKKFPIIIMKRPLELAQDHTPMKEVVLDVLRRLDEEGKKFSSFVLLQPTSPLRERDDIDRTIESLYSSSSHSSVSICLFEPHPFLAVSIDDNNRLSTYIKDTEKYERRQDYPDLYRINGAVYAVYTNKFIENPVFVLDGKTNYYEMPIERSVDIDEERDISYAEFLLKT
ncbi:MAG: acylneuraminate cytidylyltransferase family protein [Candidatus Heimdallarchaeaceae archaeon]